MGSRSGKVATLTGLRAVGLKPMAQQAIVFANSWFQHEAILRQAWSGSAGALSPEERSKIRPLAEFAPILAWRDAKFNDGSFRWHTHVDVSKVQSNILSIAQAIDQETLKDTQVERALMFDAFTKCSSLVHLQWLLSKFNRLPTPCCRLMRFLVREHVPFVADPVLWPMRTTR